MQPDFGKIYDDHATRIYRFIYYKTYNREAAEDITSETFLRAIEKEQSFDESKGSISSWLFAIARNLTTDYFRKKQLHLDIQDIWDLKSSDDVAVDVENQVQLEELRKILGSLKTLQREVIILRIWMDMPYKEIAQVLGKSEASLKMAFARTIKHLKEQMGPSAFLALLLAPLFIR
ncbi:MAG: sigma-70 family RNA polymerase sigma factor [Spirochaetaceae bacterium]|jgi:RNA polymerase sigma-70 factor (ECF subfamily)|nr:sigma-70 family RNA polymerase sigma factor [Spirochaetaceae bacterium]